MRTWLILLGGPILWTAHFFALYIIASLLPGTRTAAIFVILATVIAITIAIWATLRAVRSLKVTADDFRRWSLCLSILATAISLVAIVYQGMPALIG
jgi:hypothetical protein